MDIDRFLRRKEVEALTGLKCSSLYRYMADRKFPRPLQLGPKSVAWRESDVRAWMDACRQSELGRMARAPAEQDAA